MVRIYPWAEMIFAWEKRQGSFRTYGPEAQRLTEWRFNGGTLTSVSIAGWRVVDYPIHQ